MDHLERRLPGSGGICSIMMPTMILMIKSIAFAPGASSNSWRGSSQSQEGSSSLLSVRGPLFWLGPICSCEELWFLVVLDTASPLLPSCTSAAVMLSIVSLKFSTTSAYNGQGRQVPDRQLPDQTSARRTSARPWYLSYWHLSRGNLSANHYGACMIGY